MILDWSFCPMETFFYRLVFIIACVLICITVHEFGQAKMAKHLGDRIATLLRRDTLDPVVHIDLVWTLCLPAALVVLASVTGSQNVPFVALGMRVWHNPLELHSRAFGTDWSTRGAQWLIAIVGPISNAAMALLCFALAALILKLEIAQLGTFSAADLFIQLAYLNITFVIFHLLPIFPLDGARIWPGFFCNRTAMNFYVIRPWISTTLTAVLVLGGGSWIAILARFITEHMIATLP